MAKANKADRSKAKKPYNLRRWKISDLDEGDGFFTCARPGRTGDPKSVNGQVDDAVVHAWVNGLLAHVGPRPGIVSLLGSKPSGRSEFWFYSFFGGFDEAAAFPGRLSFSQWLHRWHPEVDLREHPTFDSEKVPFDTLEAVAADVRELISNGHTAVIVDSGGQERTRQAADHLKAAEDHS
jgi:hypothetical protein